MIRLREKQPALGKKPEQAGKTGTREGHGTGTALSKRELGQRKAKAQRDATQQARMPARKSETKLIGEEGSVGVSDIEQLDRFFTQGNGVVDRVLNVRGFKAEIVDQLDRQSQQQQHHYKYALPLHRGTVI